ncbi:hypothetical protein OUZ56_013838 [Daphnia magna]|uniref:Uncharacterized protein n=1 Tax=Daphnia magna TaxID=35525 RepID=A0ABQ9Z736_9CRUS|nr:hypothetical protein OUZ56_013838 [Daphnia magna]
MSSSCQKFTTAVEKREISSFSVFIHNPLESVSKKPIGLITLNMEILCFALSHVAWYIAPLPPLVYGSYSSIP